MNVISMAKCDGCGRLIRCAVCGKPVEAVPVLENEIFMPDGVPLCGNALRSRRYRQTSRIP
jgi:hypothetical protein